MNGSGFPAMNDGASNGARAAHLPATGILRDDVIPLHLLVVDDGVQE